MESIELGYKIEKMIDMINDIYINELKQYKNYFNKEGEKELAKDCLETYLRAYEMIKNNNYVDGVSIARSSFEALLTLIGIHISEECREAYFRANRYEIYQERKRKEKYAEDYISQKYLRKIIKKRCKNVRDDLDEFYQVLSQYIHPTIYRNNLTNNGEQDKELYFTILNFILTIPTIAILILCDLKIIREEQATDSLNLKALSENVSCRNKREINNLQLKIYEDVNKDYYEKLKKQQENDINKLKAELAKYKCEIENAHKITMRKTEYQAVYEIAQEILNEMNVK